MTWLCDISDYWANHYEGVGPQKKFRLWTSAEGRRQDEERYEKEMKVWRNERYRERVDRAEENLRRKGLL
jgi:hypothetical protein